MRLFPYSNGAAGFERDALAHLSGRCLGRIPRVQLVGRPQEEGPEAEGADGGTGASGDGLATPRVMALDLSLRK